MGIKSTDKYLGRNALGTCVVKVTTDDTRCGTLQDKTIAGQGIALAVVNDAVLGQRLQITSDSVVGIDSDEMNFVVCDATEVDTIESSTLWDMTDHYGTDMSTLHTATLHTINYVDRGDGLYNVRYHCDSTKILDTNIDDSKDMTLRYGFALLSAESDTEATIAIDMVYINTSDVPTFINVVDEYIIESDATALVKAHDFEITQPSDLKPHTLLGFYVTIFDGPTDPTSPATRATSIKMSSGTIYQRTLNYPILETQI